MNATLEEWLHEVEAHELELSGDLIPDAQGNLLYFCPDRETCGAISVDDLVSFVHAAAERFHDKAERRGAQVRFYVWSDYQAGQLRMSAVAASEQAPFGAPVAPVETPHPIVGALLRLWIACYFAPEPPRAVPVPDDFEWPVHTVELFERLVGTPPRSSEP